MRQTSNLGLALYDTTDKMNITGAENSLNHNMELLDAELVKKMAAPESGEAGQVLTKTEGGYAWQDAPAGDGSGGINDEATEAGSTWSSQKIAQEVGTKLDQETFDRVFYISEPSVNLYDPTTEGWEDNAFIYGSGLVVVDESKYAKYCVTPPIPIEAGKTYTIAPAIAPNLEAKNRARTYMYTGVVLDVMDFTKNEDGSITFTTPVGSAFIRFVVGKEFLTGGTNIATTMALFNSKFMLVEGTSAPESYIPYIPAQNTLRNIDIPDNSVKIEKIDASAAEGQDHRQLRRQHLRQHPPAAGFVIQNRGAHRSDGVQLRLRRLSHGAAHRALGRIFHVPAGDGYRQRRLFGSG